MLHSGAKKWAKQRLYKLNGRELEQINLRAFILEKQRAALRGRQWWEPLWVQDLSQVFFVM